MAKKAKIKGLGIFILFGLFLIPFVMATQCNDGLDNDGDTKIDLQDNDCSDALDNTEYGTSQKELESKLYNIALILFVPMVFVAIIYLILDKIKGGN